MEMIIWLHGTLHNGETIDYGIPMDERFVQLARDASKFAQLEVVSVDRFDGRILVEVK